MMRTDFPSVTFRRSGPTPYLVNAAIWLGIAHVAAAIKTAEPVFLWIMAQSLLLEKLPGRQRWQTELAWLVAYGVIGILAWVLVERPGSNPDHRWRRAATTWLFIAVGFGFLAALLFRFGVLYE